MSGKINYESFGFDNRPMGPVRKGDNYVSNLSVSEPGVPSLGFTTQSKGFGSLNSGNRT